VTWQRWWLHHSIWRIAKISGYMQTSWLYVWYSVERELLPMEVLHCGNRDFWLFSRLWPWPWPDDIHIQASPILPGDIIDVQIWTFYVKRFESYRLTDRQSATQTDMTEITYYAASQMVKYDMITVKHIDITSWRLRGLSKKGNASHMTVTHKLTQAVKPRPPSTHDMIIAEGNVLALYVGA